MKALKFVGIAVVALAAAMPLLPKASKARDAESKLNLLLVGLGSDGTAVCKEGGWGSAEVEWPLSDCKIGEAARRAVAEDARMRSAARSGFMPAQMRGAAEDMMGTLQTASRADLEKEYNRASSVSQAYLVLAAVVAAFGVALVAVGFMTGRKPNQRLYATEPAAPVALAVDHETGQTKCPACGGEINAGALRCMHCWKRLDGKPE